jgi:hypothetical protein
MIRVSARKRANPTRERAETPIMRTDGRLVLHHNAGLGHIDPALVTPVVEDIGEALVIKHGLDTGEEPSTERLAEIVDQAIFPAVGIRQV